MGWEATLITTLLLLMAAFLTGAPLFVAFLVINLDVAIFSTCRFWHGRKFYL